VKTNEAHALFQILADEAIPSSEVNLWPSTQKYFFAHPLSVYRKPLLHPTRTLVISGFLIIILAGVLIAGPHNVVAAIRSLVGYLPGVGFVQNTAQTRILSTPVVVERDGIRVTIEEALADSQQTVIVYRIDNLPQAEKSIEATPPTMPYLQLADGTIFKVTYGDSGGKDGVWRERLGFPPLPVGIDDFRLIISQLHDQPQGAAPENWQIPIHLVLSLDNPHIQPLIQLSPISPTLTSTEIQQDQSAIVPQSTPIPTQPSVANEIGSSGTKNGVNISLGEASQVDGQLVFGLNLHWQDTNWRLSGPWGRPGTIFAETSDSTELLITKLDSPMVQLDPNRQFDIQNFEISLAEIQGPVTITLQSIDFRAKNVGSISFNPGLNPQAGQTWPINQTIETNSGKLHFTKTQLITKNQELSCLQFNVEVDPGISSVALSDYNNFDHIRRGNADWVTDGSGIIKTSICYDVLPEGQLTIQIDSMFFSVQGPWQISFNLENGSVQPISPQVAVQFTPTSSELAQAILTEIEGYNQKTKTGISIPGWIYLGFNQTDYLPPNAPNPLPASRSEEYWFYIDINENIIKQIQYLTSPETGRILVGTLINGELSSNWENQIVTVEPHPLSYDLYLASTLNSMLEDGRSFEIQRAYDKIDNNNVIRFDLLIPYSPQEQSLLNISLSGTIWGIFEKFYFDPQSGILIKYEHAYVLESGERVVSAFTSERTIQAVSLPPQQVLDTLNLKK